VINVNALSEKWKTELEDFLKRLSKAKEEILSQKRTHSENKEVVQKEKLRQKLSSFASSLVKKFAGSPTVIKRVSLLLRRESNSSDVLESLIDRTAYVAVIYGRSYHAEGLKLEGKLFPLPLLRQMRKLTAHRIVKESSKRTKLTFLSLASALSGLFFGGLLSGFSKVADFLAFVFLITFFVSLHFAIRTARREQDLIDALLLIELRLRSR